MLALEEELHQHAGDRLVVGDEHPLALARGGVDAIGVVGQHPVDLFDRRHARGHELERTIAHRGKSGGAHGGANLEGRGAATDGVAQSV